MPSGRSAKRVFALDDPGVQRSPDADVFAARILPVIASLSLILLCQLTGEVMARGLGLPVPGPVIGLLLLLLLLLLARDRFAILARGPLREDGVESASRG